MSSVLILIRDSPIKPTRAKSKRMFLTIDTHQIAQTPTQTPTSAINTNCIQTCSAISTAKYVYNIHTSTF